MNSSTDQGRMPPFPPKLAPDQINVLRDLAVDWALAHGLVIRALGGPDGKTTLPHSAVHAPIALFPSPFPKAAFAKAKQLQPLFNTLVHEITKDSAFISEVMDGIGDVDPFTSRLYSIYRKLLASGLPPQAISLGIHRSDYLLHRDSSDSSSALSIQQVELNTIASSFGCLSSLTTLLHQYLSDKTDFYNKRDNPMTFDILPEALPTNPARQSIAMGIAEAHKLYTQAGQNAVVVMVVQPGERNAMDQRWIEYELIERFGIKLFRRTLAEMKQSASVSSNRKLIIETFNGPREVSVVYYRAGYGPGDYPTENEWAARELIESSLAVKCPTVAQQLAGAKKVQQVLALPNQLERFVSPTDASLLRSCFTGLFSLDAGTAQGDQAYEMALKDPLKYVVKPQREGGGNNVYQEAVPAFLKSLAPRERSAYIIMELIQPPPMQNVLVRQGEVISGADVVSELGIYGIWVAHGDEVVVNEAGGHLLRTKVASSHEGGVAAGFAVLDSPLLY